jgi:hypothetical protein
LEWTGEISVIECSGKAFDIDPTQAAIWCLTRDLEVRSEAAIPSVFEPRTAEAWNVYSRNTKEREP